MQRRPWRCLRQKTNKKDPILIFISAHIGSLLYLGSHRLFAENTDVSTTELNRKSRLHFQLPMDKNIPHRVIKKNFLIFLHSLQLSLCDNWPGGGLHGGDILSLSRHKKLHLRSKVELCFEIYAQTWSAELQRTDAWRVPVAQSRTHEHSEKSRSK